MKYLFLPLLCFSLISTGQIQIYPSPPDEIPSADYKVKVDDKEVFVHDSPVGDMALFGGNQKVKVKVYSEKIVRWVSILPSELKIPVTILDEHYFEFELSQPTKISIEVNNKYSDPLFMFYNPLEKVRDELDLKPNDLVFEAGKRHKVGAVQLKSGQNVYIQGGAIIDGRFWAENQKDITISGYGVVDGTNVKSYEPNDPSKVRSNQQAVRLINFRRCENVSVKDITLVNSFAWNLAPEYCKNVSVSGVNIVSGNPSDDGIDVVGCEDVLIENCFIRSKDDCIAIKALSQPKNEEDKCKNIHVKNCIFWSAEWGNGIEIGYELRYPIVEDIKFEDIVIIRVEGGAVFSIHQTDNSIVRNITYENIRIENAMDKLVDLGIFFSFFSQDNHYEREYFMQNKYLDGPWDNAIKIDANEKIGYANMRGHIENITFKDISITGDYPYSILGGYDDLHKVKGVKFINLTINGKPIESLEALNATPHFAEGIEFLKE